VIDGPVLVAEARDAGVDLEAVFLDADAAGPVSDLADDLSAAGVAVHRLPAGVLAGAVDTVTPAGIAAVAVRRSAPGGLSSPARSVAGSEPRSGRLPPPAAERPVTAALVVVLAGLQDPGNAGTLLRSAEAAGATGVWATTGTVDLFAPKTVRSSAGALFHVPVRDQLDAAVAARELRAAGIRLFGTAAHGGTPIDRADLGAPSALVLGNEAHGLDPDWHDAVDEWLTIPMVGRAESLNVAMAGTLLCFEAARQRRGAE
jgi:RNA methyltransferase, TrmH family